jgi:hypothetical protein
MDLSIVSIILLCMSYMLGKKGIFLSIVIFWWIIWLYIVSKSPVGLDIPTNETIIMVSICLVAAYAGGLLALFAFELNNTNSYSRKSSSGTSRAHSRLLNLLIYICAPIVIIILLRALPHINGGTEYRGEMFGGEMTDVIFGNSYIFLVYLLLIKPLVFAGMYLGFIVIMLGGRIYLLLISFVLLLIDQLVFLGRSEIVMFIITYSVYVFVAFAAYGKRMNNFNVLSTAVVAVTLFTIYISSFRSSEVGSVSIIDFIIDKILHNFSVGLVILSQELTNPESSLNNDSTYGFAIFGRTLEYIFIFLRRFIEMPNFHALGSQVLSEWRIIGMTEEGVHIGGNAYATVFYSIFSDGGFILGIIISFLYGFFLVKNTPSGFFEVRSGVAVICLLYLGLGGVTFPYIPAEFILYYLICIALEKKYGV